MEKFQKAPFEEIAAHCESKVAEDDETRLESRLKLPFPPQANMLHDRLAQIFELTIRSGDRHAAPARRRPSLTALSLHRPPPSPSGVVSLSAGHTQHQSVPVYEMKFPDLCVY